MDGCLQPLNISTSYFILQNTMVKVGFWRIKAILKIIYIFIWAKGANNFPHF